MNLRVMIFGKEYAPTSNIIVMHLVIFKRFVQYPLTRDIVTLDTVTVPDVTWK
jgi:hypothetical protein